MKEETEWGEQMRRDDERRRRRDEKWENKKWSDKTVSCIGNGPCEGKLEGKK